MCTRDRVNNAGIIRTGCKVTLAAIYLRRDRVVGVAPAVGIPWLRGGRAPASFSRCYAACACGTKLGEGLRRPCRGRTGGGMLGAMARIVAAGARPRNFQPLLRRLRLRHKSSARASGGLAGGRRVGVCLGRWRALSPALPVYRRRTIVRTAAEPFLRSPLEFSSSSRSSAGILEFAEFERSNLAIVSLTRDRPTDRP
jgi:hypothetical protein